MIIRLLVLFISMASISACAYKPRGSTHEETWQQRTLHLNSIKQWSVKGRISVKTPDNRFTSNLSWQHQSDKQLLLLYGSFGTTYAELSEEDGNATLILADKNIYQSNTLQPLIQRVFGYPIPVEQLEYWIRGLTFPDDNSHQTFDKSGYLKRIDYQKWTITYTKYRRISAFENIYLPRKMSVTDGVVAIRLSLRNWSTVTQL